jgi:translation initiation factor 5A
MARPIPMSTTPAEARELKVGRYMVVDDEPCKILSIDHSKPGKHGAAKVRVEVVGVFTKRRSSYTGSVTDRVQIPIIEKRTAQVVSIMGDQAQLMDMETFETFELPIPEPEVANQPIEQGKEVQYVETMGRRAIMRF